MFDNIYAQGIIMGNIGLNATGHNIFYDVGNHFNGVSSPATTIIDIDGDNNVSVGDMFERSDAFATTYARININGTATIATTNGRQIQAGTYTRDSGLIATLVNNSSGTAFTSTLTAFSVNYTIVRGTSRRTGTIVVTNLTGTGLSWQDDFVQNTATGITLGVSQTGGTVTVSYSATNTGVNGTMYYSVTRLS
jgi:hypothetical protein